MRIDSREETAWIAFVEEIGLFLEAVILTLREVSAVDLVATEVAKTCVLMFGDGDILGVDTADVPVW